MLTTHRPSLSPASLGGPRYSQSLKRGIDILGCFTAEQPTRGIANIADELDMARSTVHRYCVTLVQLGYLEQVARRKYRLALRVSDLGLSALNTLGRSDEKPLGLRGLAYAFLAELRNRARYTASIGVLDGTHVVYLHSAHSYSRGHSDFNLTLRAGSRVPAYCTAMGKVLLAYLPNPQRSERIASTVLKPLAPNTITSKRALAQALEGTRRTLDETEAAGVAVEDEEFAERLYGIAAPVRDQSGKVMAAVSLTAHGPKNTLADIESAFLHDAADSISTALGYSIEQEATGGTVARRASA